jgi:hypothetical protein
MRHTWKQARHLPFDLGEVAGVGRGEAAHKFNQCAQHLVYQVRHLPVDLGEVAGVGCVEAAHKEVGPLHHRAIHDVCAHYWGICKTKHRYFSLVFSVFLRLKISFLFRKSILTFDVKSGGLLQGGAAQEEMHCGAQNLQSVILTGENHLWLFLFQ